VHSFALEIKIEKLDRREWIRLAVWFSSYPVRLLSAISLWRKVKEGRYVMLKIASKRVTPQKIARWYYEEENCLRL